MIKDSKPITRFMFFISLIVGVLAGVFLHHQPVSHNLFQIRLTLSIVTVLATLFGFIGTKICRRFNVNDEYIINEDDKEYFDYLESNFKYYLSFVPITGILMFCATFIPFHIQHMLLVDTLIYFTCSFLIICPFFDEIYTLINAIRYQMCK